MPSELTYLQKVRLLRSRKVKIDVLGKNCFSQITFEQRKLAKWFGGYRVPLVETRWNICMLTLKSQGQNLTSVQGHVGSPFDRGRSDCMSVDVSRREKQIGLNRTALSLFYQLEAKKRIWPLMTSNDSKERSLGQIYLRIIESGLRWDDLEIIRFIPPVLL